MSKMIFEDINNISCVGVHLWRDLFHVVELKEIMRQKDDLSFAQLLNRVRLGHQTDADIALLNSRTIFQFCDSCRKMLLMTIHMKLCTSSQPTKNATGTTV